MLYFHSWSGGKDSTASIILDHIHGLPPSKIIFSEVMFDRKREISGETAGTYRLHPQQGKAAL